ncbi:hypothetical protein [Paenibacillus sp. 453mf]|uniref:hypothetical protein n=1 Tax=Paenibacillus sp. 453mf TaxID=1761874 RepID=UPI0008E13F8B|nr:hypothetical protein SAMN04488601_101406 [Paenibacillus sp. 453mf]
MKIDFATEAGYTYIADRDKHIAKSLIASKIRDNEIFILRDSSEVMGWMRYGYFWDNIPFMNLIWLVLLYSIYWVSLYYQFV